MAKGKKLSTAQRGIALSTISALVVSTLILIVGAGFHQDGGPTTSFTISQLSVFIEQFVGETGVIIFAVGFIAAALSSMLTIPLGAAITADTVFSEDKEELLENIEKTKSNHQIDEKQSTKVELEVIEQEPKRLPWSVYFGIILIEVIISTVIISANGKQPCDTSFTITICVIFSADRTLVVLVAQTFNGCLLPFFSICLLLCLNDPQFMSSSPQPGWANVFLVSSVIITLFLACNVIIQKILGTVLTAVSARLGVAIGLAVGGMAVLCFVTSLGRELIQSFKKCTGMGERST